jgi:hypothetical protein
MRSEAICMEIAPSPGKLSLPHREVRRLASVGPDPRWDEAIEAGIREARSLVSPRARFRPLDAETMSGLFAGPTPVEAIARRGRSWLFVATIGPSLESRVRDRMGRGDLLEGVLLDSCGSVAVEAICELVERECAGGGTSARFSPGYCMWSLDGQRRVFDLLRPEDLGIRLMPSMLMHPLKSVSGVVVQAPSEELLVPDEICDQCDARGCTRRGVI